MKPSDAGTADEFLFGYGSLISLESAGRTLGRVPDRAEVRLVRLRGFRRGWTFVTDSVLTEDPSVIRRTVFLDLVPAPDAACNGTLLRVDPAQWERLDRRETGYERIDVSAGIEGAPGRVFTYRSLPTHRVTGPGAADDALCIGANYVRILEAGLATWGEAFAREFRPSVFPLPFPVEERPLLFADPAQEEAARRAGEADRG